MVKTTDNTKIAPPPYGMDLHDFLQKEWDHMGTTRGAWCREAGIPDSTVHRWGQGIEPDMRSLRLVAEALHRPLVDVLQGAGYLDKKTLHREIPPRETPSVLKALQPPDKGGDPTLSPVVREALLQIYERLTLVESGQARSVRGQVRPRRANRQSD